jgi:hypothetical protein
MLQCSTLIIVEKPIRLEGDHCRFVTSSYIATAQHAERYLDEEANLVWNLASEKIACLGLEAGEDRL